MRQALRALALPPVPAHERFHVGTALAGLAGAPLAAAWLLARAATGAERASAFLLGAGLAAMFLATALHHWFPASERLRRADHASIYLAIVGVAAPVCLLGIGGGLGRASLLATGALAALGVGAKSVAPFLSPRANLWLYLPVPAPVLALAPTLARALAPLPAALLLASVLAFLGGAVADARASPAPRGIGAHGLFHCCVLAGAALAVGFAAACFGAS